MPSSGSSTLPSPTSGTTIIDPVTGLPANITLDGGKNKLETLVTISAVVERTKDAKPDTYFTITAAGAISDTVRVQLVATANDSTSPDRDIAAVDETYTLVAADVGDELKLRDNLVIFLNGQAGFNASLVAEAVTDRAIIWIQSKFLSTSGEFYERPTPGDFAVTLTGTTSATLGFDTLISRAKETTGQPDPDNPHVQSAIGVAGTVNILPAGKPPKFFFLTTSGGSTVMNVDGSSGDVVFKLSNDPNYDNTKTLIVVQIRLHAVAGSMQLGTDKYIEVPVLTNGHLIEIRSENNVTFSENLKLMEDIHHRFAIGRNSKFQLITGVGNPSLVAELNSILPIKKTGTFTTDDDITSTVRDDLGVSGISKIEIEIVGFEV